MDKLNIVIVTHGLTLRLLLMRYFQLSVEEFEHSFNPQNSKIVIMDRIEPQPDFDGDDDDYAASSSLDTPAAKPFFRLDEEAKEALNLTGDVSSEKPVFFRGDALAQIPYDLKQGIRK